MANFDTLRIRAGYDSKDHNYAVSVPIYQTASFDLGSVDRAKSLWALDEQAGIYSRVGNPTVSAFEERIAALDHAHSAVALSSGMAAISYTILSLTEGGGNIVAPRALYGGTEDSFSNFFPRFGSTIKFVDNRFDPESYEELIDDKTRGIYIETISNPNAEIYDIEAIAEVAHRHDIPLIVDNTVATPYLINPFDHGADIIVYSATKAIGGHGNTIAGIVEESGKFFYSEELFPQFYEKSHKIRNRIGESRSAFDIDPKGPLVIHLRAFYLEFIGAALSPFSAFLLLQGVETISERVDKQTRTAEKLVKYLEGRKEVEWVKHPSATNSPFKELADKYFPKGAGYLFTFGFGGTERQLNEFIQHLKYFSYHVNIGDVRSLIVNSPKTTHAELDEERLERAGINENTVRISVGLESPEDLIKDLDDAFNAVFSR
ncbi:MAG: O-acetylhomoserine aminocarboxypropyltransferase/cysteine synthase [Lachnospiraceae bacterium]|nr:O-acetylhomoserine aminocarboxypropyltransferase/cysteine synthase [Lachnospiraceae bacterium]